jgi:8-oxo-dGTP pyrophosphatase MutT (NUDIX family)
MSDNTTATPAASILLLRDGPSGLEVFMQQRHHKLRHFSGALVFPGGKLDAQDRDPRLHAHCDPAGTGDDYALALRFAAIREAFEECGVLLARPRGDTGLVDAARVAALSIRRDALNAGTLTLHQLVEAEQLVLACERLVYFANWIPPEGVAKRFDTYFFLARVPADQQLLHDGSESVDSVWITPAEAVAGAASGRFSIVFPTLCNLQKLALRRNVEEALASAASQPVVRVQTRFERRADGVYGCIPPEAGYPVNEALLPELSDLPLKS